MSAEILNLAEARSKRSPKPNAPTDKEALIEQLMRRIAANLGLDLDASPWTPEADDPAIDEEEDGDPH